MTGSPDISTGETTKPVLTVVEPAITELLCVQRQANKYEDQTFSVLVQSQDTETNPLSAVLLLDYGTPTNVGEDDPQPWVDDVNERVVPVGSLNDEPRLVSLVWPLSNDVVQPGTCHSLTMLVARERFEAPPYFHCPKDDQFATVTWFAALEEDGDCGPALATCPIAGTGADQSEYCPDPEELAPSDGGAP